MKDKNHTIISIHTEKSLRKIQHPFIKKAIKKVGIEEYLNIIKTIYGKPIVNIILNGENLKSLSLKSGTRHGYTPSSLLFNLVPDLLAIATRQHKLTLLEDYMILHLKDSNDSTEDM
jgi:hypothetical protein